MFLRTFYPLRFLQELYGTSPFLEYCRSRAITFPQLPNWVMRDDEYAAWLAAIKALPASEQAKVELELAQVNELAEPASIALLIAAANGDSRPHVDLNNTALALWFFLNRQELFREVFLQNQVAEVDGWRAARVARDIRLADVTRRKDALAASLHEFFHVRDGTGRFCTVDAYSLPGSICFMSHVSDRTRLLELFTETGEHTRQAARPAIPILFVYYPDDGRMLLKARQRAADKILALFQRFGRTVLGIDVDERCLPPAFRLDVLKQRFDPPRDADDMEMVRVKALHLAYPERDGRRQVKLETLASDGQYAILDLLREHGGNGVLDYLAVVFAELQVKLRVPTGTKSFVIRLWPDRCSLNQTALGNRLHACLKRWGIAYAE